MESNNQTISLPTNRQSIISLVLGVLTLLSLCGGLFPIPFTGFVCFPASFILGILALVFGLVSLNRIRKQNETGHPMAWAGIVMGGFVLLCLLCMLAALVYAIHFISPGTFPTPPFLKNFQV